MIVRLRKVTRKLTNSAWLSAYKALAAAAREDLVLNTLSFFHFFLTKQYSALHCALCVAVCFFFSLSVRESVGKRKRRFPHGNPRPRERSWCFCLHFF